MDSLRDDCTYRGFPFCFQSIMLLPAPNLINPALPDTVPTHVNFLLSFALQHSVLNLLNIYKQI